MLGKKIGCAIFWMLAGLCFLTKTHFVVRSQQKMVRIYTRWKWIQRLCLFFWRIANNHLNYNCYFLESLRSDKYLWLEKKGFILSQFMSVYVRYDSRKSNPLSAWWIMFSANNQRITNSEVSRKGIIFCNTATILDLFSRRILWVYRCVLAKMLSFVRNFWALTTHRQPWYLSNRANLVVSVMEKCFPLQGKYLRRSKKSCCLLFCEKNKTWKEIRQHKTQSGWL